MEGQTALRPDRQHPGELGERFVGALGYAARAHAGQRRANDGQPYVAHLLRVTGLVIQDGGPEDEAIAALLHDAVEDQGGLRRLKDIRDRYGDVVADMVDECTDSYEDQKPPWRARKERYLAELGGSSPGSLRISMADKLDNVSSVIRAYRIDGEELWRHLHEADVMADRDQRDGTPERAQGLANAALRRWIESGRRLVEYEQGRLSHERAR